MRSGRVSKGNLEIGDERFEFARSVELGQIRVTADVLAVDEDVGHGALRSLVEQVGLNGCSFLSALVQFDDPDLFGGDGQRRDNAAQEERDVSALRNVRFSTPFVTASAGRQRTGAREKSNRGAERQHAPLGLFAVRAV